VARAEVSGAPRRRPAAERRLALEEHDVDTASREVERDARPDYSSADDGDAQGHLTPAALAAA
jgi:hypothetical protein